MDLVFRENYWDEPESKAAFKLFLQQVFQFDLSLWDENGFWDRNYRPLSLFRDNQIVSSVCVYTMEIVVQGRPCRAAQISAVGTLPEFRRRGLSLQLMHKSIEWAQNEHDFLFLFANEEAYSLYQKCGFRPIDEFRSRMPVTGRSPQEGAVRLDMQKPDDITLAYKIASDREPVSDFLGVMSPKLLMYWCLYAAANNEDVCYVPSLDTMVLYQRKEGCLLILDIVAKTMPRFVDLHPYISEPSDEAIEFRFMIDKLGVENCDLVKVEGNGLHLRGDFPLIGPPLVFPQTSHA